LNEKDDDLSYISNDLILLLSSGSQLIPNKIDNKININKNPNKEKIIKLLNEVPLHFLVSFLGYAYYKYKISKDILDKK